MQRYTNVAQDALGNVIQGMSVSVFLHGTQTLATIYSDNGITTIPNPVTTDALGTFFFYAANGRYDLQFAKTGLPTTQLLDILLEDPSDPSIGGIDVASSIAALKALAGAQLMGQVQVLGYYVAGDNSGGLFRWNASDATADNGGTVIIPNSAPGTGRWNRIYDQAASFSDKWFGVKGDGVTVDTTAFNAARAIAVGHRLLIHGTPLIDAALTISSKEHWIFDGASGNSTAGTPNSYLIKKSTVNADLVTITAQATMIENGGIFGQGGNGGNGFTILANGVTLMNPYVNGMGNDGIRVGQDATGVNANSFKIYNPVCVSNTRHGIYINDDNSGAAVNANAGLLAAPTCLLNGADGIKADRCFYLTILSPISENNTGIGLHAAASMTRMTVIGGDCEQNTARDVQIDNGATFTKIYGTNYSTITDNGLRTEFPGVTAFTPTLTFGGAAVGMTFGTQAGFIIHSQNFAIAFIDLILTAKGSSVGVAVIGGLPNTVLNAALQGGVSFGQVLNMTGLTGALMGYAPANDVTIQLGQSSAAGFAAIADTSFTNTSTIRAMVVYPLT